MLVAAGCCRLLVLYASKISASLLPSQPGKILCLHLVHLREFDINRGGTAKDATHHLQRLTVFVDVVDSASEVREWTLVDADLLALVELDLHRRLVLRHIG